MPRGRGDKKSKHRLLGALPLSEDRLAWRTERSELRGGPHATGRTAVQGAQVSKKGHSEPLPTSRVLPG